MYVLCFCLVHARRQFYELPNGYDDVADQVIGLIGRIYDHEAHTKGFNSQKRLAYHQEKSTPVMAELKLYLEEQKAEFEPNSVAGKAIDYILNRWTQLSQFLRHLHAPLDTNIVERALKLVIQVRKSSMFYKSLSSAAFASSVQSALYSAAQNEINPCDYMCARKCILICVIMRHFYIPPRLYAVHKYHSNHHYLLPLLLAIRHEVPLSTTSYVAVLYIVY